MSSDATGGRNSGGDRRGRNPDPDATQAMPTEGSGAHVAEPPTDAGRPTGRRAADNDVPAGATDGGYTDIDYGAFQEEDAHDGATRRLPDEAQERRGADSPTERISDRDRTRAMPQADGNARPSSISAERDPRDGGYRDDAGAAADGGTRGSGGGRAGAVLGGAAGAGAGLGRGGRDSGDGRRDAGDAAVAAPNRESLLQREKEAFGGMKFGAAFFGWLSATGMLVLLSALAAAIAAAVGLSNNADLGQALNQVGTDQSAGIAGAIIALAVLLIAYFAGGYVAGRMARFNGLKQGLAVWIWGLIISAVVIVLGLIFGNDISALTQANALAPLPESFDEINPMTWLTVGLSLAVALVGALLGGLAGMRYHRRIDKADFGPVDDDRR